MRTRRGAHQRVSQAPLTTIGRACVRVPQALQQAVGGRDRALEAATAKVTASHASAAAVAAELSKLKAERKALLEEVEHEQADLAARRARDQETAARHRQVRRVLPRAPPRRCMRAYACVCIASAPHQRSVSADGLPVALMVVLRRWWGPSPRTWSARSSARRPR